MFRKLHCINFGTILCLKNFFFLVRDLLDPQVPVDRTDCLEQKEPKEIAGSWVPQDQEELQYVIFNISFISIQDYQTNETNKCNT